MARLGKLDRDFVGSRCKGLLFRPLTCDDEKLTRLMQGQSSKARQADSLDSGAANDGLICFVVASSQSKRSSDTTGTVLQYGTDGEERWPTTKPSPTCARRPPSRQLSVAANANTGRRMPNCSSSTTRHIIGSSSSRPRTRTATPVHLHHHRRMPHRTPPRMPPQLNRHHSPDLQRVARIA